MFGSFRRLGVVMLFVVGASSASAWGYQTIAVELSGKMVNGDRRYPVVAMLRDGRVLMAGGYYRKLARSPHEEIYSPQTGQFSLVPPMRFERFGATGTLLPDGRVLVIGGHLDPYAKADYGELYDPVQNQWSLTARMLDLYRAAPSVVLLPTGKVLIVGDGYPDTDLYDPTTNTFTRTGKLNEVRLGQRAVLLQDGRVLVVGGFKAGQMPAIHAEIYDPTTGVFTVSGAMHYGRMNPSATLLADGRVLVAGGYDVRFSRSKLSEIYDVRTGVFTRTGNMIDPQVGHSAVLLPNGNVLVAFGDKLSSVADMEIFDPVTDRFRVALRAMGIGALSTVVMLQDGRVFLAPLHSADPGYYAWLGISVEPRAALPVVFR